MRSFLVFVVICSFTGISMSANSAESSSTNDTPQFVIKDKKQQSKALPRLNYTSKNAINFRGSVREYEDAIYDLESAYGPFDSQISQELIGLGLAYQEMGDHENAISTFQRAVHVTRINEGIYNMSQVEVIEQMIESYIVQGKWEEAEEQHFHLYWLNRRSFDTRDPRMLPVINKLSLWHLEAYTNQTQVFHHLVHAHELFRLAVNIIDNVYGPYDLRLIKPLKGLTASNYYLHKHYGEELTQLGDAYVPAKQDVNSPYNRLLHYTRNSRRNGSDAIQRMMEVYDQQESATELVKVQTRIRMADWRMVTGRKNLAMSMYKDIYREVWNNEEIRDEILAELSKPVALPDFSYLGFNPNKVNNELNESYVLLQFDVTAHGKKKNVQILETSDKDKSMVEEARRSLKKVRFRPRMIAGVPGSTKGVVHRYVFN